MITTLPPATSRPIMIVGDAMLDVYQRVDVSRISQEAPVPVAKMLLEPPTMRLGGAANVAANCAAMGAERTMLLAAIGSDSWGTQLATLTQQAGVRAAWAQAPEHVTTIKTRIMGGRGYRQQLLRIDTEAQVPEAAAKVIKSAAIEVMAQPGEDQIGLVVLSDYAKGAISDPQPIIRAATATGLSVIVDPKSPDWEDAYAGATVIKPNEDEFLEWLGVRSMDVVDYSLVRRRMAGLCRHLVITRGERGAKIVAAVGDGPPVHVPAVAKGARDVTGAGDTVLAAMAAWWDNTTLTEAVTIGMHAAACAVMHVGTQVVDRASIERMLTFSRSEANHAS